MATPSLSYDPATLRLMYDGTIATNAALMRPAPVLRTSCGAPQQGFLQVAQEAAVKCQVQAVTRGR